MKLTLEDVHAMIRLVGGTAAVPGGHHAMKHHLMDGLTDMIGADVWIWSLGSHPDAASPQAFATPMIDGLDGESLAKYFAAVVHPDSAKATEIFYAGALKAGDPGYLKAIEPREGIREVRPNTARVSLDVLYEDGTVRRASPNTERFVLVTKDIHSILDTNLYRLKDGTLKWGNYGDLQRFVDFWNAAPRTVRTISRSGRAIVSTHTDGSVRLWHGLPGQLVKWEEDLDANRALEGARQVFTVKDRESEYLYALLPADEVPHSGLWTIEELLAHHKTQQPAAA